MDEDKPLDVRDIVPYNIAEIARLTGTPERDLWRTYWAAKAKGTTAVILVTPLRELYGE